MVARSSGETTEDGFEPEQHTRGEHPSENKHEPTTPDCDAANAMSVEDIPPDGGYGWVGDDVRFNGHLPHLGH